MRVGVVRCHICNAESNLEYLIGSNIKFFEIDKLLSLFFSVLQPQLATTDPAADMAKAGCQQEASQMEQMRLTAGMAVSSQVSSPRLWIVLSLKNL
jgi:hypothetical protein